MDYTETDRVVLVDHPLVKHKIGVLRAEDTPSSLFRQLVRELAQLEAYEATRDLPTTATDVTTPIAVARCESVRGRDVVIVPIIRAGLGMTEGMLDLIPTARVGHLGMYRDPETHRPHEYYANVPEDAAEAEVFVVDPMLATGGSAIAAIEYLRKAGVKNLKLLVLVAVPEGIDAVLAADPDVAVYTCAIDDKLNENAYIVPGLGDAGDRIFGTC